MYSKKINVGETLVIKKNFVAFTEKNDAEENKQPNTMIIKIAGINELNNEEYSSLMNLVEEIKGKKELGLIVSVKAPIYPPNPNSKL